MPLNLLQAHLKFPDAAEVPIHIYDGEESAFQNN
jgi:hypothetical protein